MENPAAFLAEQETLLRKRSSRSINSPVPAASAVKLSVAPSDPKLLEKSGRGRSFFGPFVSDQTTLLKVALAILGGLCLILGVAVVMLVYALGFRGPGSNIWLNASTGPTYVLSEETNKITYANGTARTFSFSKRSEVLAADDALAAAGLVTVETKWPNAADAVVPSAPPIPHGIPSAIISSLPPTVADYLDGSIFGFGPSSSGTASTNATTLDGEVGLAAAGTTTYTRCYTRTVVTSTTSGQTAQTTTASPTMTMTTPQSQPASNNWYFQLGSYFGW